MPTSGKNQPLLRVVIDTPIWQAYFCKEAHIFQEVNALLDAGQVCCLEIIVAELLQTSATEKEMKIFEDFTRIFPLLMDPPGALVEAARLSFQLRRKGQELSLRDCYVAVVTKAHGALLYTTNKALYRVRKTLGLEFFPKGMLRHEVNKRKKK